MITSVHVLRIIIVAASIYFPPPMVIQKAPAAAAEGYPDPPEVGTASGWFHFQDDGTTDNASTNDLTHSGGVTWTNQCLQFDGVDGFATVGARTDFFHGSTNATFAFWARFDADAGTEYPLGAGATAEFTVQKNTGGTRTFWGVGAANTVDPANWEVWVHVAVTYDDTDLRTYFNGELVDTKTLNDEPNYSADLYIGRWSSTYMAGDVDDVYLHETYCATSNEIYTLWSDTSSYH